MLQADLRRRIFDMRHNFATLFGCRPRYKNKEPRVYFVGAQGL